MDIYPSNEASNNKLLPSSIIKAAWMYSIIISSIIGVEANSNDSYLNFDEDTIVKPYDGKNNDGSNISRYLKGFLLETKYDFINAVKINNKDMCKKTKTTNCIPDEELEQFEQKIIDKLFTNNYNYRDTVELPLNKSGKYILDSMMNELGILLDIRYGDGYSKILTDLKEYEGSSIKLKFKKNENQIQIKSIEIIRK